MNVYQPDEQMTTLLYSEVRLAAGAALAVSNPDLVAFSKGQTEEGQGFTTPLTAVQTNMKKNAQLEADFVVTHIGVEIVHDDIAAASNTADAHKLRNKVAVALEIGNSSVPLGPLGTLPADFGLDVQTVTAASGGSFTAVNLASNGRRTTMRAVRPTVLAAGMDFGFALICDKNDLPTPTAAQRLRFYLAGFWR